MTSIPRTRVVCLALVACTLLTACGDGEPPAARAPVAMLHGEIPAAAGAGPPAETLTRSVAYSDGRRTLTCWANPSYLLEFVPTAAGQVAVLQASPGAEDLGTDRGVRAWRLPEADHAADVAGWLADHHADLGISLVYHDGRTDDTPIRYLPGGVIVELPATWSQAVVDGWAAGRGLTLAGRVSELSNMYRVTSRPGRAALDLAAGIHASGEVAWAVPVWVTTARLE